MREQKCTYSAAYVAVVTLCILTSVLVYDGIEVRLFGATMFAQREAESLWNYTQHQKEVGTDSKNPGIPSSKAHFQMCVLNQTWPTQELIYNMVPKCGSLGFRQLCYKLSGTNNFTAKERRYSDQHITMPYHISPDSVKLTIERQILIMHKPWLYFGHLHFIDFQKANYSNTPVYINIIRDPIERLASFYYYRRRDGLWFPKPQGDIIASLEIDDKDARINMSFNECVLKKDIECADFRFNFQIMPHFCGQDPHCIHPSRRALDQAKMNTEKHFAVIGLVEKFSAFLEVVECVFPRYFAGLTALYQTVTLKSQGVMHRTRNRQEVSPEARQMLLQRQDIKLEYEFYNFVREKFNNQYRKYLQCSTSLSTV